MSILEKHYAEPLEIHNLEFKVDNLRDLLPSNVLFPRRVLQHEINTFNRSGWRGGPCLFYLDASKLEDIIDFWNLRAVGRLVFPIPKQYQSNPQLNDLIMSFLKTHRRPWSHDPKHCDFASIIRARNCTMDEMQAYAKTLKIERDPNDPSSDPFFALQHWYPRIWDEWARDKDGAVSDDIYGEKEDSIEISDTKDLRIRFRSLLPNFAQKYGYHGEPRCANEISFRFYGLDEYIAEVFPKSSGKNFIRSISGLASFRGDWRVGRNGLVKLVRDGFNETRDIPLAENVFFAWLEDLGWKPKLSAPGLLAKDIYRQLEGHLSALKNEKLLGLIEHMNGGTVKLDGTPVEENTVNQERELPVGEVKSRLAAASSGGDLHDYLVKRGIFKLGARIKCPQCLRSSWFALENVRDTFTCPRCSRPFQAIGNLDSSTWCYKTVGPFSVPNYADGAYSVLLSLDFFDERRLSTMRVTTAFSFVAEAPDKKNLEADFAAFWQEAVYGERKEGLLLGECKTYGRFGEKDFDRMRYLAKTFPGAVLVFSTLRKSLTSKEIAGITRIAKAGRKHWKTERPINPVLILTGNELLSQFGPPYCWEETIKKKFDHIGGLLSICDATQQIYLNLSSWQTEWSEKWEKRRRARLKKPEVQQ